MQTPANPEVELALLKTSFYYPEAFRSAVLPKIVDAMFSDRSNAVVYSAMRRMEADGRMFDLPILKAYIGEPLVQQMGEPYFEKLMGSSGSIENLDAYITTLVEQYILRVALDHAMAVANKAVRGHPANEVISTYTAGVDTLMNIATTDNSVLSMGALDAEMYPRLKKRIDKPGFSGIRTGLVEYDYVVGGLQKGHFVLIAARPSVGKTSLLLSILLNAAKQGVPSGLFSFEMSLEQIYNRAISMLAEVSHLNMVHGNLQERDIAKVHEAHDVLTKLPLYVAYAPAMNIDEVATATTKLVRTRGLEIAALDYVQLLLGRGDANRELTYISRRLKLSAGQDGIAWVVASQLNRLVEFRENKRPILSDLRDSGSLEQDADIVGMIYREFMYNPSHDNEYDAEFLIRKNRHGPIVDMSLRFDPSCMKFSSGGMNYG